MIKSGKEIKNKVHIIATYENLLSMIIYCNAHAQQNELSVMADTERMVA